MWTNILARSRRDWRKGAAAIFRYDLDSTIRDLNRSLKYIYSNEPLSLFQVSPEEIQVLGINDTLTSHSTLFQSGHRFDSLSSLWEMKGESGRI